VSTGSQLVPPSGPWKAFDQFEATKQTRREVLTDAWSRYLPILVASLASRVLVFACAGLVQLLRWPTGSLPGFREHPLALLGVWDGHCTGSLRSTAICSFRIARAILPSSRCFQA
jgi:hypothetical protein